MILVFRGYFISCTESLTQDALNNNPGDIERSGFMLEATYMIKIESEHLMGIQPKVRYDNIKVDNLEDNGGIEINNYDTNTISMGVNVMINKNFRFSFDHNVISENGQNEISNDRFVAKIIAKF